MASPVETSRKKVVRTGVHIALEVKSRFALEMRVGPRTLGMATALVVAVAMVCPGGPPLFLIDDHRPYPAALLQVFGEIKHRRRGHGRGRKCKPALKPPPKLLVGVVQKVRDAKGHLQKVKRKGLFGTAREIEARIRKLGIGHLINTSHLERFNGTVRSRQDRGVCVILGVRWFGSASVWGLAQLFGEAVLVGGLGIVEWVVSGREAA